MSNEQYRSANKSVFLAVMVMLGYIFGVNALVLTSGLVLGTAATVIVSGVGIVASVAMFIMKRDTDLCAKTMLIAAMLTHLVDMCSTTSSDTYVYGLIILFIGIVYMNAKYLIFLDAVVIIANLVFIAHIVSTSTSLSDTVYVVFLKVVLISLAMYIANTITRLLITFNRDNLKTLTDASERQKTISDKLLKVADELVKRFDVARNMMDSLKESYVANNASMGNIARSTESTAQSVQEQAEMCIDIQSNSEKIKLETTKMRKASEKTIETVHDGDMIIKELKEHAGIVGKASADAVESTEQLKVRVYDVKEIVETILNISTQTNLLALNASIEAARAGEAGRGFAVVASEIRGLSEQTKTASNKIADIIRELIQNTEKTKESIDHSAESVVSQNEIIETTKNKFGMIGEEVKDLTTIIYNTENVMQEILKSTSVISDNISQLSATSEEVAASSNEGVQNSSEDIEKLEKFSKILDEIYALSEELKITA